MGLDDMSSIYTTSHASPNRLLVKSLEDVREPIDAMLNKPSIPRAEQPDEGLTGRLTGFIHHQSHYYRHDTEKRSPVESETEPLYVGIIKRLPDWLNLAYILGGI